MPYCRANSTAACQTDSGSFVRVGLLRRKSSNWRCNCKIGSGVGDEADLGFTISRLRRLTQRNRAVLQPSRMLTGNSRPLSDAVELDTLRPRQAVQHASFEQPVLSPVDPSPEGSFTRSWNNGCQGNSKELLACARSENRVRRLISFAFSNSARYFWAWRSPMPISRARLLTAGKHLPSCPAYRASRPYAILPPGDTSLERTRASGIKMPVNRR